MNGVNKRQKSQEANTQNEQKKNWGWIIALIRNDVCGCQPEWTAICEAEMPSVRKSVIVKFLVNDWDKMYCEKQFRSRKNIGMSEKMHWRTITTNDRRLPMVRWWELTCSHGRKPIEKILVCYSWLIFSDIISGWPIKLINRQVVSERKNSTDSKNTYIEKKKMILILETK